MIPFTTVGVEAKQVLHSICFSQFSELVFFISLKLYQHLLSWIYSKFKWTKHFSAKCESIPITSTGIVILNSLKSQVVEWEAKKYSQKRLNKGKNTSRTLSNLYMSPYHDSSHPLTMIVVGAIVGYVLNVPTEHRLAYTYHGSSGLPASLIFESRPTSLYAEIEIP